MPHLRYRRLHIQSQIVEIMFINANGGGRDMPKLLGGHTSCSASELITLYEITYVSFDSFSTYYT